MTGSGSPCGACKFLRRKCMTGCVFAPYFSYEEGATHFAAVHKVFGASNVSKLLSSLPFSDRCEAAVTIAYEAQARLQDPIYGCVSQIFALQQQIFNLQAQVAFLKEQTEGNFFNGTNTENPNERFYGQLPSDPQEFYNRLHPQNSNMKAQIVPSSNNISGSSENGIADYTSMGCFEGSFNPGKILSFGTYEEGSNSIFATDMEANTRSWSLQDADDDLKSVAFGYIPHSS